MMAKEKATEELASRKGLLASSIALLLVVRILSRYLGHVYTIYSEKTNGRMRKGM
jgi:hypothetical protein